MTTGNIPAATLTAWGEQVFGALGCPAKEASLIATNLVRANLYGHDSHGIGLLPTYVAHVRSGHAAPGRTPRIVVDSGAMVGLDGDKGFGQAIGESAMAIAIERAREHGCVVVGLANTHHLGRIGQWGERCADAGFVSVHFVNVRSRPLVAPFGGSDARVSTNPVCVAVPHKPHALVLDYATSAVALGKTRVAVDERKPMADGLLLDREGRPTNDPSVMWGERIGAILPFAQHKGWALSMMCEILAGGLTGGHVQDGATIHPMLNNMLSIVFDPARLVTADALAAEVERLKAWVCASPQPEGSAGIFLPGEPEQRTFALRSRQGIPLPSLTIESLASAASALGVATRWKDSHDEREGVRVAR
ncbi:MAG TPA: malate/lactate/ureidoglycolate dehydrogenase [Casimicrobiaceae bacterium]|nr:malate/lactate/ureidoglycolate dehydrogenase [Casimicrobiaceae bacterium]